MAHVPEDVDENVVREALRSFGYTNVSQSTFDEIIRLAAVRTQELAATTSNSQQHATHEEGDSPGRRADSRTPVFDEEGHPEDHRSSERVDALSSEEMPLEEFNTVLDDYGTMGGSTPRDGRRAPEPQYPLRRDAPAAQEAPPGHHRGEPKSLPSRGPQQQRAAGRGNAPTAMESRREALHRSRETAAVAADLGTVPSHLRRFEPYDRLERDLRTTTRSSLAVHLPTSESEGTGARPSAQVDQENIRPSSARLLQPHFARLTSREKERLREDLFLRTGNKAHRPEGPLVLNSARRNAPLVRKHSDPVSRGQHMRDCWQKDPFLTQKGRQEERWRVRLSMLQ